LADIEAKILYLLSNCKGNILDDVEIIDTLDVSKKTSNEINIKLAQVRLQREEKRTKG
jgi:dynein heavy chain